MSDVVERAKEYRDKTQPMVAYAPDEVAYKVPEAYDRWKLDVEYEANDVRRYGDGLYRCVQNHKSQDNWTPDVANSLWTKISDPGEEWPKWVQPIGSHDAYAKGAKVSHKEKHWTSNDNGNVWEPGVYGWTEA